MRAKMLINPALHAVIARIHASLRGVLPLPFYIQSPGTPISAQGREYPAVSIADDAGAALLVLEFVPEATAAAGRYAHYQAIPTLQYIVLAELGQPRILLWHRTPDGGWDCRLHTGWQAVVDLPELECKVPLRYLYADPPYARPLGDAPHKSLAQHILDIPVGDPIPDRHDDEAQHQATLRGMADVRAGRTVSSEIVKRLAAGSADELIQRGRELVRSLDAVADPKDLPPRLLSVVALLVAHGAAGRGAVGTVIEVLSANTCLVEFAGADGVSWAIRAVPVADLIELRFGPGAGA